MQMSTSILFPKKELPYNSIWSKEVIMSESENTVTDKLYCLGIDGGGTKTEFCMSDSDGKIVNTVVLGPSNPFDIGIDKTIDLLRNGINTVAEHIAPNSIKIFSGIAGSRSGNFASHIDSFFRNLGYMAFRSGSDIDITVDATLGNADGISVIMGTGQCVILKSGGETSVFGGLGYLFDMGGSGYDLGAHAIRSAIMAEEGSGKSTVLRELILKRTGSRTVREQLLYLYSLGKSGIASFAPLVFEAYELNDTVAEKILRENMHHIATLIYAAEKRLKTYGSVNTVISGGLTGYSKVILPVLREELDDFFPKSKAILNIYTGNMAYHASQMALKLN